VQRLARIREDYPFGELTHAEIRCAQCGEPLHADEVTVEAGPGSSAGHGTRVVAERLAAD
jgi:hypothetical protein